MEALSDRDKPEQVSRQMLADVQERAFATAPVAVVLVERLSDYFALEALAVRCGRDLRRERVAVVPMGGATNIGNFLALFGPSGLDVRLAGLCDLAEEAFLVGRLERAGIAHPVDRPALESCGFFVCTRDLEDELIRALGTDAVEMIIEDEGELTSLRRLQQMPFHRERNLDEQLHRFLGVRSGRKYRYAPLLTRALDARDIPRPLHDLLAYV